MVELDNFQNYDNTRSIFNVHANCTISNFGYAIFSLFFFYAIFTDDTVQKIH